jgi:fermentation-respiration switch protein FrsA (DUF1100 family)
MKVRTTIAGTAFRARLTALCWGALTILAPVAVSACDGSTSTPTVSSFSPTVATLPASDGTTPSPSTPGVTSTATVTPVATVTQTVTVPAATATSFVPTAAPVTGGGGTAGLQDGLLFVLGAAAILAGVGSILYRRRFTRHR